MQGIPDNADSVENKVTNTELHANEATPADDTDADAFAILALLFIIAVTVVYTLGG